jgi:hypothetical protein
LEKPLQAAWKDLKKWPAPHTGLLELPLLGQLIRVWIQAAHFLWTCSRQRTIYFISVGLDVGVMMT